MKKILAYLICMSLIIQTGIIQVCADYFELDWPIAFEENFDTLSMWTMQSNNYSVINRADKLSIRHNDYKRNIRIERAFGEEYSIENIKKRILEEHSPRVPFIEAFKFKTPTYTSPKKYVKSKNKPKGIIALYHHYCFLLKVYPNSKNITKRLPASIRADIRIMDKYSEEVRFLSNNKLDTKNQLLEYKNMTITNLNNKLSDRESMWRYRDLEQDENKKNLIINQISDLNKEISKNRKELKLIEDIENRIPKIQENLQEMKNVDKNGKEKLKNEKLCYRNRLLFGYG